MTLQHLRHLSQTFTATDTMPALFAGHGSPMNAIELNDFSRSWQKLGKTMPRPQAILCISAHWETIGTYVTAMEKPKTIHDFGGFPQALFDVQYPAPGSPALATETISTVHSIKVGEDQSWGLDHGCWSVLKHIYPLADVPVIQMSLDYTQPAQYHYDLARELSALRRKGVLILGSGNMVHNLGMVNFSSPDTGFDWAIEANEKFKKLITDGDFNSLIRYTALGRAIQLSIPTPEHYLPLLYILALKEEKEKLSFYNDKTIYGSLSMTSVLIHKG